MSAIIIDSEIVHYEVLGRGRPLIFVHGWVGSWRYWIPAMQSASVAFRSYAIDLWGFGDTAKSLGRYNLKDQADLLGQFMEKMGIGKVALVGHGLGAIIAILFAEKYSQFVDRVMAVSYPLSPTQLNSRLGTLSPTDLGNWLLSGTPDSESTRQEALKADLQAIKMSLLGLNQIDLLEMSKNLGAPCLLVRGHNDPAISSPPEDQLSKLPEISHFIAFDASGHFPMLDEANKFNRLLADFLSLESGESPQKLQLKEEWKRRVR